MLARAIYLDVAPYMRGRISPQKNYAAGVKPGDVMMGGAIAEVVHSNAKPYKPGDIVVTDHNFGWQEYAALRPSVVRAVDPKLAPLPVLARRARHERHDRIFRAARHGRA